MNVQDAAKRLKNLGFSFWEQSGIRWGETAAEDFNAQSYYILSEPYRDVFIGEIRTGWYISSHINFVGQRYRCKSSHKVTILNIFGKGKTLEEALTDFEYNFTNKIYNVSEQ